MLLEMQRFFEDYKALEHKHVTVERFMGREDAYRIIEDSITLYNETFPNGSASEPAKKPTGVEL
jgi:inorganic pyrophosphatase